MAESTHHNQPAHDQSRKTAAQQNEPLPAPEEEAIQRVMQSRGKSHLTPSMVMRLQRVVGNRFVQQLAQKPQVSAIAHGAAIQRVIAYDASGLPVAETIFEQAEAEMYQLITNLRQNAVNRLRNDENDDAFATALENAEIHRAFLENEPMRRQIIQQAQQEYSMETINFMNALTRYKGNPAYATAVEMYNEYIARNVAPQEINLRGGTRNEIATAIQAINNMPSRGRDNAVANEMPSRGRGNAMS